MSITRYTIAGGFYQSIYGNYVSYNDHLAAVESLEYDIRYEREQKEELQEELEYHKKHCTKELWY